MSADSKVVAWMCEKTRDRWHKDGTKSGKTYIEQQIVNNQDHADMLREDFNYRVKGLVLESALLELQAKHDALVERLGKIANNWENVWSWTPIATRDASVSYANELRNAIAATTGGEG